MILILIACLGTDCREVRLADNLSLFACMTSSQPLAANWIANHPDYKVRKIRCEVPNA